MRKMNAKVRELDGKPVVVGLRNGREIQGKLSAPADQDYVTVSSDSAECVVRLEEISEVTYA